MLQYIFQTRHIVIPRSLFTFPLLPHGEAEAGHFSNLCIILATVCIESALLARKLVFLRSQSYHVVLKWDFVTSERWNNTFSLLQMKSCVNEQSHQPLPLFNTQFLLLHLCLLCNWHFAGFMNHLPLYCNCQLWSRRLLYSNTYALFFHCKVLQHTQSGGWHVLCNWHIEAVFLLVIVTKNILTISLTPMCYHFLQWWKI